MLRANSYPVKYAVYGDLKRSSDEFEFSFTSVGPNGAIPILVQFNQTEHPGIYNLAFGRFLDDGNLDDHARLNNHDRDKILASVAAAVYGFTLECPDKTVYFTGSTEARTRLYRMAITMNLDELLTKFDIFGWIPNQQLDWEQFRKGRPYVAFAVTRKNNNLQT